MKWGSRELLDGSNGIYFDYTTAQGNKALSPTELKIIKQTDEMCEVLYSATSGNTIFQQGYIMRNDIAGVYTYVIATGTATSASEPLKEVRVCTRLTSDMLNGYVDYRMNGKIPTNAEMAEAEKIRYRMPPITSPTALYIPSTTGLTSSNATPCTAYGTIIHTAYGTSPYPMNG